ncbi:hypothetical protein B0T17DRAFT_611611 [Bombardia bombarda]|uniref:WW domain-containing protein n=1 Tax=Bombardia bombarda TaxID=252184 RepID=A0AA39XII5_9PEZI|nr:hypothetical protein B0T17DRAFT_611611 [Bombardia bombarda]
MAGPASPGSDGPTYAPPNLPAGWIAQWDGSSKEYYFVQLSTGLSQWETPTVAAPVGGGTPASHTEHPYGVPGGGGARGGGGQIITHPDGSQTVKHADGTMEPLMPREDGTRGGVDGPTGDRGLGSMLGNALMSNLGGGGRQSSGGGGLAGQLISGFTGGGSSHSGGNSSGGIGGKLASQLASNLFSGGSSKPSQSSGNYHGGQSSSSSGGGLAGSVMGGVASMFGGKPANSGQNFGYSNSGQQSGSYTGQAPPISYQPPSAPGTSASANSSYHAPQSQQHHTGGASTYHPPRRPTHHQASPSSSTLRTAASPSTTAASSRSRATAPHTARLFPSKATGSPSISNRMAAEVISMAAHQTLITRLHSMGLRSTRHSRRMAGVTRGSSSNIMVMEAGTIKCRRRHGDMILGGVAL